MAKRKLKKYGTGGFLEKLLLKQVEGEEPEEGGFISGLFSSLGSSGLGLNPIGLGLGLGLNTIRGVQESRNRYETLSRQSRLGEQVRKEEDKLNDKSLLNIYPTEGIDRVSNFADGGKLLPINGRGGAKLAVGDSHEKDSDGDGNTGILLSLNGEPVAEIEDGEVIDGDKVFSNRLGFSNGMSFAKVALMLTKTKEYKDSVDMKKKYGEDSDNVRANIWKRGTAKRMLSKNPNPLDKLFELQEQMKLAQNRVQSEGEGQGEIPKGARGLDLSKILGSAGNLIPYLDNIYNSGLIANAPQLPVPELGTAPTLKTDFNINPQLTEINRDISAGNKAIQVGTSSSAFARPNIIANNIQGTYAKNRLLGEKENIETGLKNQQAVINAETGNRNRALLNDFRLQNFQRTDDIRREKSANVANAVEDARMQQVDNNQMKLDKQRMTLIAAQYMESGVLDRSGFEKALDIIDKGGTLEDAIGFMNSQRKRIGLKVPERLPARGIEVNSLGKGYKQRNRIEEIMSNLLK